MPRIAGVVVSASPRADGQLSLVEVSEKEAVFSTGETVLIRYQKLRTLCEQLCQDQAALHGVRTWWTKDGNELIELHRVGGKSTETLTAPMWPSSTEGVF